MRYRAVALLWLFLCGVAGPATGGELWRAVTEGDVWDLACTGDLDGDTSDDLIAGAADNMVRAIASRDGGELWSFPTEGDVWCVSALPDLDGDGVPEVGAGTAANELLILTGKGDLWYRLPTSGDVWCLAPAGDVTGDGVAEIACGSADNKLRLVDIAGKRLLWERDLGGDVWSVAGGADLNGDGTPDVVAGTAADMVVALSGRDGAELWRYETSGDVWDLALGDDVNGDGVPDVVAGTAFDRILCLSGRRLGGPVGGGGGGRPFLWQSAAGSDVHVIRIAQDYNGDGVREVLAGGLDDMLRLLDGKTGNQRWRVQAAGAVKDAIVADDLDGDGFRDFVACTEGSTVEARSSDGGASLWTYYAEISATFWSLAPLPDLDGDGVGDVATGSALNLVIALPGVPHFPPDSVSDLQCVAAQTSQGPGVLLTWRDPADATSVTVVDLSGPEEVVLGTVPAGTEELLAALEGAADPRDLAVWASGPGGESEREICTVTLAPPPVVDVSCEFDPAGRAAVWWVMPDPGLRDLDGIRVFLNGQLVAELPPDAVQTVIEGVDAGRHTVVVRTVWGPWESPDYSCIMEREGEGVGDLTCAPIQLSHAPGVRLTWSDAPGSTGARVLEIIGGSRQVLAEIPAGVGLFEALVAGDAALRQYGVVSLFDGVEGPEALCTVSFNPPAVTDLSCGLAGGTVGKAWWNPPDPGRLELSIEVFLDGRSFKVLDGSAAEVLLGELQPGVHTVEVRTVWGPWESEPAVCTLEVSGGNQGVAFVRADANGDGGLDIADVIRILAYLFSGAPSTCRAALDSNGDQKIDIGDAIYILGYLFGTGPKPPEPFPECGTVPGADCETFPACR